MKQGHNIDGLVQDCSSSSALTMELLQSCTKPSIYTKLLYTWTKYHQGPHFINMDWR